MEIKPVIYTYRAIKKTSKRFVEGEYGVQIRIAQKKERQFIPLGFSSSISNWDEVNWLPRPSHPHYKELSRKIVLYLDELAFELKLAQKAQRHISCIEIKRKVFDNSFTQVYKSNQLKILELFDKVIIDLEEVGNPGYADVFESTRSTVSKLLNNNQFIPPEERGREKDRLFSTFTRADHQKYEQLITAGTSESTRSLYLRTYYRIWNIAIEKGYCTREEHHPSKFIKFRAYKRIKTRKRSINEGFFQKIINIEFPLDSRMFRSQMLLQFMYYARGINFGDLCRLKWDNISNQTIYYVRSKNHRSYDYTLHPRANEIIEYFKSYLEQSNAGYIFPILYDIHNTPRKIKIRIHAALKCFNEDLKQMSSFVGWERKFTSYSLRHSFATHLKNNGVDISFIKNALGHNTEEQTAVYLDDLDDKPIADEITRALVLKK